MPARIHTHDMHVESRILKGCIVNIDYDAHDVAEGGSPLYLVTYRGDKYEKATKNLMEKSSARLVVSKVGHCELREGDCYTIQRHTLHEVLVPTEQTTITLVRMHSHQPGAVKVIGIDGYPGEIAFERDEWDASILLSHF